MTAWLDRILGRVTMYALVIIRLGLHRRRRARAEPARAGQLRAARDPGRAPRCCWSRPIVVEPAVRAASSGCGRRLSSTVITALLLLFIFAPTLDPVGLGMLALAGVVATATSTCSRCAAGTSSTRRPPARSSSASLPFLSGDLRHLVAGHGLHAAVHRGRGVPDPVPHPQAAARRDVHRRRHAGLGRRTRSPTAARSSTGVSFALLLVPDGLLRRLHAERAAHASAAPLAAAGSRRCWSASCSPCRSTSWGVLGQPAVRAAGRQPVRVLLRAAPRHPADYVGKRQLAPTSWEFEFAARARRCGSRRASTWSSRSRTRKTDARGWRRVFSIASAPVAGATREVRHPPARAPSTFKKALLALEPGTRCRRRRSAATSCCRRTMRRCCSSRAASASPRTSASSRHSRRRRRSGMSRWSTRSARPDDLAYADLLAKAGCSAVTVVSRREAGEAAEGLDLARGPAPHRRAAARRGARREDAPHVPVGHAGDGGRPEARPAPGGRPPHPHRRLHRLLIRRWSLSKPCSPCASTLALAIPEC